MGREKQMRERLVKLLQDNSYLDVLDEEHWLLAAEQLLANGVVVIDTDVVSPKNRPLISQYMGRPIDEVINLIRGSEWISVDERLPTDRELVLVSSMDLLTKKHGWFYLARYTNLQNGGVRFDDKRWISEDGGIFGRVTHWMPLPEAPKMKGGAEE